VAIIRLFEFRASAIWQQRSLEPPIAVPPPV
jgi:hypothetical protein